jgi:pyruvate ferredoxin oxidoreductase gamma subunit
MPHPLGDRPGCGKPALEAGQVLRARRARPATIESMFQVRIHGRGGQGVVTAAELLSVAAFSEGRSAQAFPTFGSERTGAPVVAFCRIDDEGIRIREPITEPDAVIVQDPTLLHQVDLFAGLGPDGYLLLNTGRGFADLVERFRADRLLTVPATEIAREHVGRPLPNAVLLGAFAALTGVVTIGSVAEAIEEKFPGETGRRNVRAAQAAHSLVRAQTGVRSVA